MIEDTLKVKVTDPAGKAVQGWNYELTLPNGQMAVGKVDDAGLVKHEHVPPGKHHLKLIDPKRDEKKAAKEKAAKVEKAKPNSAGMGGDKEADNNPEAGAPANKKKNESIIHVGIFFDGTNNNRDRDRPLKHDTNVSKLFDLYKQDNETHFKYYFEGVGTGNWSKSDPVSGRFSGRGVADRIQRAEKSLKEVTEKHPESEIRLSVFGFSRGGGTALAFVNHLYDGNKPIQPMRFNDRMAYNPKKSSTTIAPQDEKTLKRLQFEKVWFMGLFDTVASIGVPGDDDEVTHDISAKQSRIRKLTHFVARDERRGLFPCSSIHQGPGSNLPSGWEERTFPGAHSDVGGGYEVELEKMNPSPNDHGQDHLSVAVYSKKGDHLSRVAGWAMYDAALESYVPMYPIREMQPNAGAAQKSFDNIMKGGKLNETPENGWVTFSLTEGMAKIPKGLVEAISLLSIPFPLIPLWKSRKSELSFKSLIDVHHPDFKDNIYSNSHESLGLMDPKGIGSTVGINPSPRTILYRGAL